MTTSELDPRCNEVAERMSEILDGTAPEELRLHMETCDRCRDARFDAERAAALVASAGRDYFPSADFEARLLEKIDRAPSAENTAQPAPVTTSPEPEPVATPPVAPTEPAPAVAETAVPTAKPVDPTAAMPATTSKTDEAPSAGKPKPSAQSSETRASARSESTGTVAEFARKHRGLTIAGALAVAAGALLLMRRPTSSEGPSSGNPWRGKVSAVSALGPSQGLKRCDPSGAACTVIGDGSAIAAGSRLETDGVTRVTLAMDDGSELVIDRSTMLVLGSGKGRSAKLVRGGLVADVAHREGDHARFDLPGGYAEVVGTKLSLRALEGYSSVEVARGAVRLVDDDNHDVSVRAGEAGRLEHGLSPVVVSAPALADAFSWSERSSDDPSADSKSRGLGELRAKKPGTDKELDHAVTLASHKVRVRIAGAMARTEIDETFSNQTDQVLEGIYRFPLPPDAKIERLALEVDGKLEEGAFVERDKAAKIWRGAIVNAAPDQPKPVEEIIWVPGPWRDPALLEWQRGNRFELRIYPIPKRGSRRLILAYTELLAPTAGVRRYNYPLPHDPGGSTRVADFGMDVEVRGFDAGFGVRPVGYDVQQSNNGGVAELKLERRDFVPSGDLTVEYALADRKRPLTAWGFRDTSATGGGAGYVAIALRPDLPRAVDEAHRHFVLAVDSSRSVFGESYKRASALAVRIARELDPLDKLSVLACDSECREMPGGARYPGVDAARATEEFLSAITPEGASDVTGAIAAARRAAKDAEPGGVRVVYIGDGTPTVGPVRGATVDHAVRAAVPSEVGTVTALAVGSDSDVETLSTVARAGGGVMLPFVPGQSASEATYALLGATYGHALRNVRVELPSGLSEIAPAQLGTVVSGSEAYVAARASGDAVRGDVVLRGDLGGKPFEQRFPLDVSLSSSQGNAFVPRVFASLRISDLEHESAADAHARAVELSQRFNVASRYTSLLVLESAAMFKAFGLDTTHNAPAWTGEQEAEPSDLAANDVRDDESSTAALTRGAGPANGAGIGTLGAYASGGGADKKSKGESYDGVASGRAAAKAAMDAPAEAAPAPMASTPPPAKRPAPVTATAPMGDSVLEQQRVADRRMILEEPPPPPPRRRWIAMHKVWKRVGAIITDRLTPKVAAFDKVSQAEFKLRENEDSRDRVVALYTLYALSGDLDKARALVDRWTDKEPMGSDALTARADLAARMGRRDDAIRMLGSVVDVRPDDVKAQLRLARLERWRGNAALGCRYLVAISELKPTDSDRLSDAVRCARQTGEGRIADDLLSAADDATRTHALPLIDKTPPDDTQLSGDLRAIARWDGMSQDLDISFIDPDGHRVSWLGAPTRAVISARDVTSTSTESLALRGGKPGEYLIEIVRARGDGTVHGQLELFVAGKTQTIPFTLSGDRQSVAIGDIHMVSELVPL